MLSLHLSYKWDIIIILIKGEELEGNSPIKTGGVVEGVII